MSRSTGAPTKLLRKLSELQFRLEEAEGTLNAIRTGEVDALIVHTPQGEQLFTLKGADQTYRALVEAMAQGALTVRNDIIAYCNHRFAEMAGAPLEKIIGSSLFDFVESWAVRDLLSRLQNGKETYGALEAALRQADGTETPVLLSGSRFISDEKPAVGLVVTDIGERKKMEQMRRDLSHNILAAQERERQRVARDLHDGVNQLLAAAKFRLHDLASRSKKDHRPDDAVQVLGLIEKAIAEVRLISQNLRPAELDDLGLPAAMRTLVRDFEGRSGIRARFTHKPPTKVDRLARDIEMTLYRIAQESLNNVEKHSRAKSVSLALSIAPKLAELSVRDDGKGISDARKHGSGLQNMIERSAMLGGRLVVVSSKTKGTTIYAQIPLFKQSTNSLSHA